MTNPKAVAGLADKLIAQGHAEAADKPLIEKFIAREPEQAKRLADVAFKDPRSARYMGVSRDYADAPRFSDRFGSGQTMRTESNQAKHLAVWLSPEGTSASSVESYLKANAIVKSLVDIRPVSGDFSAAERDRLMDIAGDVAFGQSMSSEAVSWKQTRAGSTPEAGFARDLATLQETAMVMTPDNVFSGRAADELQITRGNMGSADGQRLLTTMKLAADLMYDGQLASSTDYASDFAKYGPWKQVVGTMPQHSGLYISLDAVDRVQEQRASNASTGPAASGPSFWQRSA